MLKEMATDPAGLLAPGAGRAVTVFDAVGDLYPTIHAAEERREVIQVFDLGSDTYHANRPFDGLILGGALVEEAHELLSVVAPTPEEDGCLARLMLSESVVSEA